MTNVVFICYVGISWDSNCNFFSDKGLYFNYYISIFS